MRDAMLNILGGIVLHYTASIASIWISNTTSNNVYILFFKNMWCYFSTFYIYGTHETYIK